MTDKNKLAKKMLAILVKKSEERRFTIPTSRKLARYAFDLADQFCKEEEKHRQPDPF